MMDQDSQPGPFHGVCVCVLWVWVKGKDGRKDGSAGLPVGTGGQQF